MTNPLHDLAREGVSVWLDDLSRERLVSGSLAAQIEDGTVVGVTTNPSIFKAAITGSHLYDEKVARYARAGADGVVRALTTEDVRDACDLLAPVYERTGGGLSELLLTLQGSGDYEGAAKLTNEQGRIGPELQADLDRLQQAGIPVDVEFQQGLAELGLAGAG